MQSTSEIINAIQRQCSLFSFLQVQHAQLGQLVIKLERGNLVIPFIGEFKSGKSSLVNAILNHSILEYAVLEATSCIYELTFSNEKDYFETYDARGTRTFYEDIALLKGLNAKDLRLVKIYLADKLFHQGLMLVDTPGLSSVNGKLAGKSMDYVPEADLVFFTVDVNQGISASITNHLRSVAFLNKRIILLLTKADTKPEREVARLKQQIIHQFSSLFSELIITSAKTTIEPLKARILSLVDVKSHFLEQSAKKAAQTVAAAVVGLIDYNLSITDLEVEGLNRQLRTKKREFEKINEEVSQIIRHTSQKIAGVAAMTVSHFESTVATRKDGVIKASLEAISEMEILFSSAVMEMAEDSIQKTFIAQLNPLLDETCKKINDVISATLAVRIKIDMEAIKQIQIKANLPILRLFSAFFRGFHDGAMEGSLRSEDPESAGASFLLAKLAKLCQKGTDLLARGFIRKEIGRAFEEVIKGFKRNVGITATEVEKDLWDNVRVQIASLEAALIDSLNEIKTLKQANREAYESQVMALNEAGAEVHRLVNELNATQYV